jgi:hypothetical protein
VNGFGCGSLTVSKEWALYGSLYPVPLNMRPIGGGWKMAVNGVCIASKPSVGSNQWWHEIHDHHRRLLQAERADPTWASMDNDVWWPDFYGRNLMVSSIC